MIETTARRDRRTSTRLDRLIDQATSWHEPPSGDTPPLPEPLPEPLTWPPDPPPSDQERTATARSPDRSVHDSPPAEEPPPIPAAGASPPVDLDGGWPVGRPWWRRAADRLSERWRPECWVPRRTVDPPRWRLAILAAGGVLVGVAVAIGFSVSGSPDQREVPPALPAASVSEVRNPGSSTAPASSSIVISVVGRVTTPGLVTLPDGSRVADALKAAGGPVPAANLGSLNLARRLSDGEQLYVGIPVPPGAEVPAAAPAGGQPETAPVDLNSASLAALDTLPGVGPVTAQRIVEWRTSHGRFGSVEQLREIEGIGPTRFGKLKDLVVAR